MERLLHYVWMHKIFPLKELKTTSGYPVEVIDPGVYNRDAGPDFFNAKVKINGTLWVGNVEIHTQASDWYRHNHDKDKVYDSVILHIAETVDCEVYRTNGETIPQLQLLCPEHIRQNYESLKRTEMLPRCHELLPELPKLTVHSWLTALQSERFAQKAEVLEERLRKYNNNWEDTFFVSLCRNFGFGLNGDAFEKWATLIPFRAVDKHRDELFQVEAIFFGQAGLLLETLDEPYYKELQREFYYLKRKFGLETMDASLWRFLRLRPGNFPHVRIAQLAYLYNQERALFSQVMEAETVKQLKRIFYVRTSAYWEEHYQFYHSSARKSKLLSDSSLQLIIINTVVPFLYAYGKHKGSEELCERAESFLEELKAENNHVTRLWSGVGLTVTNAADSQALLQLKKEYCDKRNCLHCRFGFEYLKSKRGSI